MSDIKDSYTFVTDKKSSWTCVGIRGGIYDGVVYKYGKVSLPEKENDDGTLQFKFEYDIVDANGLDKDFFRKDFFDLIGDILVDIIDEQMKEDNFEYTDN